LTQQVLGLLFRIDIKNEAKSYQGPSSTSENAIRKSKFPSLGFINFIDAGWRQYFVTIQDHAPGGTTTRARFTLLDAWPDANETSHGRSLPLGEVLATRSSVSQPFLYPFLSRF
jgi:hypothetical protein